MVPEDNRDLHKEFREKYEKQLDKPKDCESHGTPDPPAPFRRHVETQREIDIDYDLKLIFELNFVSVSARTSKATVPWHTFTITDTGCEIRWELLSDDNRLYVSSRVENWQEAIEACNSYWRQMIDLATEKISKERQEQIRRGEEAIKILGLRWTMLDLKRQAEKLPHGSTDALHLGNMVEDYRIRFKKALDEWCRLKDLAAGVGSEEPKSKTISSGTVDADVAPTFVRRAPGFSFIFGPNCGVSDLVAAMGGEPAELPPAEFKAWGVEVGGQNLDIEKLAMIAENDESAESRPLPKARVKPLVFYQRTDDRGKYAEAKAMERVFTVRKLGGEWLYSIWNTKLMATHWRSCESEKDGIDKCNEAWQEILHEHLDQTILGDADHPPEQPQEERINIPSLGIDISVDEHARCLHRIVRSMHDGHCPKCGEIHAAEKMRHETYWQCPDCGFLVDGADARAALREFQPIVHRSLSIWREWIRNRHTWINPAESVYQAKSPE